jgi:hypothetical protein
VDVPVEDPGEIRHPRHVDPPGSGASTRCAACGTPGSGAYCSACGAPREDGRDPFVQVVDSFLKVDETRRYLRLYGSILRAPTRKTIAVFERCGLADGIRFLEISTAVYLLAVAVSGIPIFGKNEIVSTVVQAIWPLLTFSLSYAFYYLAMRRQAGMQRTRREYITFVCLTLGFTMPLQIPGFFGILGIWGDLYGVAIAVPLFIYLVRAWRYFWRTSGARVFWTLFGCTLAGGAIGLLVLVPIWLAFGIPVR